MTPTDRATLRTLGLTAGEFAALTGVHPTTVSRWDAPYGTPAPPWVRHLLDAWTQCPTVLEEALASSPHHPRKEPD